MKRIEWVIVLLPLIICWVLDRVTKLWANGLTEVQSYGYLNFVLHHNHGAMLGLFSELPQVLRIVSLSTGGAFLLCIYVIIQYLLPIKSLVLRTGLSILIGGILGNVADRIIWGYVVDFIVLGTPSLSSPAFNVADAVQWVGYAMIVSAIIKEGEILWPENNTRRKYWVNPSFQLKYCFVLLGVGIGLTVISLVFSYTYLRVSISELVGGNQFLIDKFISPFVVTFLVISVGFCGILFTVGKIISHRIAGPLYAFERFLDDTLAGRPSHLKLRAGDEFKHLEELSDQIKVQLMNIQEKTMQKVASMEDNKILKD
ncbi:MAG: signal peptidase II [Bdellovibrionaceae bacterium]|nr:signal peptidase II [Pseudobdellovibrionaceae bacterium]